VWFLWLFLVSWFKVSLQGLVAEFPADFGSLDRDLLDIVMTSLERLQGENMSVGIISHVEELKNMIPVKLEVDFDEIESSSKVKLSW